LDNQQTAPLTTAFFFGGEFLPLGDKKKGWQI
jgi:hypothetical protein